MPEIAQTREQTRQQLRAEYRKVVDQLCSIADSFMDGILRTSCSKGGYRNKEYQKARQVLKGNNKYQELIAKERKLTKQYDKLFK